MHIDQNLQGMLYNLHQVGEDTELLIKTFEAVGDLQARCGGILMEYTVDVWQTPVGIFKRNLEAIYIRLHEVATTTTL